MGTGVAIRVVAELRFYKILKNCFEDSILVIVVDNHELLFLKRHLTTLET